MEPVAGEMDTTKYNIITVKVHLWETGKMYLQKYQDIATRIVTSCGVLVVREQDLFD